MKQKLEVVAALIQQGEQFLICQRPADKAQGNLWEFAGGKVEQGETPEQALVRECREELEIDIEPKELFMEITHEYTDRIVHLMLFYARIKAGKPFNKEHQKLCWATPAEMQQYEFCPADVPILEKLKEKMQ